MHTGVDGERKYASHESRAYGRTTKKTYGMTLCKRVKRKAMGGSIEGVDRVDKIRNSDGD